MLHCCSRLHRLELLPHLHVNVAVCFALILKIFAQIMANFSALGMRPHPLHPHAVRLCMYPFRISLCEHEPLKFLMKKRLMRKVTKIYLSI